MIRDFDVCIIGSGAGGGPVAYSLTKAGYSVVVLEKGPWFTEEDFKKDEIACCRRSVYTPNLRDERHVIEEEDEDGNWDAQSTFDSGWDFWNGNCVGGSSNFMSGYFHRLKPEDFRLLSEFGPIEGANVVDWPITYDQLEPYYSKVETSFPREFPFIQKLKKLWGFPVAYYLIQTLKNAQPLIFPFHQH